ncbi:MBL fold metallo-hydrolase [Celerinatantimonas yamalensis]|uniref:Ribonuclease Z n=1 Tax=Celerinatantimonas yamalensis TaxID=559956 RepID=A0ABW9G1E0_9GAMM
MKIEMLGIGSAYSCQWTNAALMIRTSQSSWLIDCGPTVPQALWRQGLTIDQLDVIYFTHIHADHCLGLPALLNYLNSHGRRKPLTIMAQPTQQELLQAMLPIAYIGESLGFVIHWQDIAESGQQGELVYASALSDHSISNRSLWLEIDGFKLFYSGDGRPTAATIALMQQSDLIIHECGMLAPTPLPNGHADLALLSDIAKTTASTPWRLYHCPDERRLALNKALEGRSNWALAAQAVLVENGQIND